VARILAFDFGTKRVGIAASDPLQIIATSLGFVATASVYDWIKTYLQQETVDTFVVGLPLNPGYAESEVHTPIRAFAAKLQSLYPHIPLRYCDERFTSKIAEQTIRQSGVNKKTRRQKGLTDTVSANLILQTYMQNPAMAIKPESLK